MVTDTPTRPTIDERYAAACQSSNLRSVERKTTDADVLAAAAWMRKYLGSALLRLRREFDQERLSIDIAARHFQQQRTIVDELRRTAARDAAQAELLIAQADEIDKRRVSAMRAEFAAVFVGLTTLDAARNALHAFAVQSAARRGFEATPEDLMRLVGKVLDAYLDPLCPHCGGRKVVGSQYRGELTTDCRPCRATGLRKHGIFRDIESAEFGGWMLCEIDRLLERANSRMRNNLKSDGQSA